MSNRQIIAAAASAALLLGPATAWSGDDEGHHKRKHHVVTIGNMEVHPKVIQLPKDEVVVWVNYSDETAQIAFPEGDAQKFTCPNLKPTFHRSGDGKLVSRGIGSLEFALPCRLAPGSYDYEVYLSSGFGGMAAGIGDTAVDDPERTFQGKIVVK